MERAPKYTTHDGIPVTFTGLDARTDVRRLRDIQQRYPNAEFGILFSETRTGNENRYPEKRIIHKFQQSGVRLALHVCGRLSRATFTESYYDLFHRTGGLTWFDRIQLNGLSSLTELRRDQLDIPAGTELILQQDPKFPLITSRIGSYTEGRLSLLMDASGGEGIDTPFQVADIPGVKVGYAGGINPGNVIRKLEGLLSDGAKDFWIDMETGVRTNDWLDLDKVEDILKQVEEYTRNRQY